MYLYNRHYNSNVNLFLYHVDIDIHRGFYLFMYNYKIYYTLDVIATDILLTMKNGPFGNERFEC